MLRATIPPCVMLIDDHAILLDGLRLLLTTQLGEVRVVTAMSLGEAIQVEEVPDAIVLDIKLTGINGLEGLPVLRRRWPQARVVMLSSQDDMDTRQQALARGALDFVSKEEAGERIVETICNVLNGSMPMRQTPADTNQPYLTPRQCEVLDLLSQGLTNKLIAKRLGLSDNTVRRHMQDIFSYFGAANRTEAIFAARRQGLVA